MSDTNENIATKQKVEDLLNQGSYKYNNWEIEFLSDMTDVTEFTDNQVEKIEELWRKHCE